MAKGDSITVIARTADSTITSEVRASQNGRTVELDFDSFGGQKWVVVTEKTRGGTLIRKDLVLASEVIRVSEHHGRVNDKDDA